MELELDISSFGAMKEAVKKAWNLQKVNEKGAPQKGHLDFPVSWKIPDSRQNGIVFSNDMTCKSI